jgi:hypothetical protein
VNEDVVTRIQEAKEAVEASGLDLDSPAGVATLRVLLERSLSVTSPSEPEASSVSDAIEGPRERIASELGVEPQVLDDYMTLGDEESRPELRPRLLPRGRAEQQRRLAIIKLALDRFGYGIDEVPVRSVMEVCEYHRCRDKNLARNLESYDDYIVRRGSGSSAVFRLTREGLDFAREVLRDLLGRDGRS